MYKNINSKHRSIFELNFSEYREKLVLFIDLDFDSLDTSKSAEISFLAQKYLEMGPACFSILLDPENLLNDSRLSVLNVGFEIDSFVSRKEKVVLNTVFVDFSHVLDSWYLKLPSGILREVEKIFKKNHNKNEINTQIAEKIENKSIEYIKRNMEPILKNSQLTSFFVHDPQRAWENNDLFERMDYFDSKIRVNESESFTTFYFVFGFSELADGGPGFVSLLTWNKD